MASRKKQIRDAAKAGGIEAPKLGKQTKRKAGSATEASLTSDSEPPQAKGRPTSGSVSAGSTSTDRQGSRDVPKASPVPEVPIRRIYSSAEDASTNVGSTDVGKQKGARKGGHDWTPVLHDSRQSPYAGPTGKGQGQGPRVAQPGKGAGKGSKSGKGSSDRWGSYSDNDTSWSRGGGGWWSRDYRW